MKQLREKMKEDLQLFGLASSTQAIYLKAVANLSEYYEHKPLIRLTTQELRAYLLYLMNEKKLAPRTYNVQVYAIRFVYAVTLKQPERKLELPTTKVDETLPDILSPDEVQRILKSTGNLKHRVLLMVIYSAGLRVSEALNLQFKDIDSDRMTLHIRGGKSRRDRIVMLSPLVLSALRELWKVTGFTSYIFYSKKDKYKPMTSSSALQIFQEAKQAADVTKSGGIHSLRHAFATHVLEAGNDIFVIKELLGHKSVHSTTRYLALVPGRHKNLRSPIESLNF